MKLMGFNLLSEDCKLSALVYSEIFQWQVLKSGIYHAELRTSEGILIIFSPNTGKCKVGVGSFTVEGIPNEKFLSYSDFFKKDQDFPEKNYSSYLDRYFNRIWFYNL